MKKVAIFMLEKNIFFEKKLWMIHHVTSADVKILDTLDPKDNILVWDDGVMSQNRISELVKNFTNILAVSPHIASLASLQNQDNVWDDRVIPTQTAHDMYHLSGDATNFLTWDMIRKLKHDHGVIIALHGNTHQKFEKYYDFLKDAEDAIECYIENLEMYPEIFVFPYNDDDEIKSSVISALGMIGIGKGRYDASKMLFQ